MTQSLPATCPTCRSLDFVLESLEPPLNIAGQYSLTVVADSTCSILPEAARARSYRAVITTAPTGDLVPSRFSVAVTGAALVEGYDRFAAAVAGGDLTMFIGDSHGTPGLVEEVERDTFVTFDGVFSASGPSMALIEGAFTGFIGRCSGVGCYRNGAAPGAGCFSLNHRMTFSRVPEVATP